MVNELRDTAQDSEESPLGPRPWLGRSPEYLSTVCRLFLEYLHHYVILRFVQLRQRLLN